MKSIEKLLQRLCDFLKVITKCPCSIYLVSIVLFLTAGTAQSHGFNANRVKILKLANGKYRIIAQYTHVEAGEYREAIVDFEKKQEALKVYKELIEGADFFLGESQPSLHFHKPVPKNNPF